MYIVLPFEQWKQRSMPFHESSNFLIQIKALNAPLYIGGMMLCSFPYSKGKRINGSYLLTYLSTLQQYIGDFWFRIPQWHTYVKMHSFWYLLVFKKKTSVSEIGKNHYRKNKLPISFWGSICSKPHIGKLTGFPLGFT